MPVQSIQTPFAGERSDRYHRQSLLPAFGPAGQARLAASNAVLVGCGALGSMVAEWLARAGVGTLTIIDRDIVERTNLQRQVLFDESDAAAGMPKAAAAAARLAEVNSEICIRPIVADLNPRTAENLCEGADVVIDGTDNFQTRYLVNDVCVKNGWPLVYGGVVGTTGMTMTIVPLTRGSGRVDAEAGGAPTLQSQGRWHGDVRAPTLQSQGRWHGCLRCVFPDPPAPGTSPTCDTAGVLGPMVGAVASVQAAEAMKVLLGRFDLVRPALVQFDLWNNTRTVIDLSAFQAGGCPCCVHGRFEFLEAAAAPTTALCGTDSVQVLPGASAGAAALDLEALAARLAPHGDFSAGKYMLRGRLRDEPGIALTIFRDARAIVQGTTDAVRAKSIYARYVGT